MAQISEAAKERERQERKFLAPIPETVSTNFGEFDKTVSDTRSSDLKRRHQHNSSLSISGTQA